MRHGPQATRLMGQVLHGPLNPREMAILDVLRTHSWALTPDELRHELGHLASTDARRYCDNLVEAGLAERDTRARRERNGRRRLVAYRITELGRGVF